MNDPMDEPWTAAEAVEEVREIRRQISAEFDDMMIPSNQAWRVLHGDSEAARGPRGISADQGQKGIRSLTRSFANALSLVPDYVSCRLEQLGGADV